MKLVICEICHKMLDETPEGTGRSPCPVCGSISRVYEDSENLLKCLKCGDLLFPVPFSFQEGGGLCEPCTRKANPAGAGEPEKST